MYDPLGPGIRSPYLHTRMNHLEVSQAFPANCHVRFNHPYCQGSGKVVGLFPSGSGYRNWLIAVEYDTMEWHQPCYAQNYPVFLVDLYDSNLFGQSPPMANVTVVSK